MNRRLLIYAVLGYAVALAVLVPLKIRGELQPFQDWFKILVLPALGVAVLPAYVIVAKRFHRAR